MEQRVILVETVLNSGSDGRMCNLCFFYSIHQYLLSIGINFSIEQLMTLANHFNLKYPNQMLDMGDMDHLSSIEILLGNLHSITGKTFRLNIYRGQLDHVHSTINSRGQLERVTMNGVIRELDGNSFGVNDANYTIDIFNIPGRHFELISEINGVKIVDTIELKRRSPHTELSNYHNRQQFGHISKTKRPIRDLPLCSLLEGVELEVKRQSNADHLARAIKESLLDNPYEGASSIGDPSYIYYDDLAKKYAFMIKKDNDMYVFRYEDDMNDSTYRQWYVDKHMKKINRETLDSPILYQTMDVFQSPYVSPNDSTSYTALDTDPRVQKMLLESVQKQDIKTKTVPYNDIRKKMDEIKSILFFYENTLLQEALHMGENLQSILSILNSSDLQYKDAKISKDENDTYIKNIRTQIHRFKDRLERLKQNSMAYGRNKYMKYKLKYLNLQSKFKTLI